MPTNARGKGHSNKKSARKSNARLLQKRPVIINNKSEKKIPYFMEYQKDIKRSRLILVERINSKLIEVVNNNEDGVDELIGSINTIIVAANLSKNPFSLLSVMPPKWGNRKDFTVTAVEFIKTHYGPAILPDRTGICKADIKSYDPELYRSLYNFTLKEKTIEGKAAAQKQVDDLNIPTQDEKNTAILSKCTIPKQWATLVHAQSYRNKPSKERS